MTREELIKYCRYYKGEEDCPFERNTNKSRFWHMEKNYVISRSRLGRECRTEGWENEAKKYIKNYPQAKNILTSKDVSIHTKGIVMYINEMLMKWCPLDVDMINEY